MIFARYKKLTAVFIILSIFYLALSVMLAPDKVTLARYHITRSQDARLTFTITIPYIIIWSIALLGYVRLRSYSDTIKRGKDGAAFQTISKGVLLLSLWLPISSILGTICNSLYHTHPSIKPELVNINNLTSIILLFFAFFFIEQGTNKLMAVIKKSLPRLPHSLSIGFMIFSAYYLFLVLLNPARQFATSNVQTATYYLPDWLIILVIVIPRLITWYIGLQSLYKLYIYRKTVKGPIYKEALNNFAMGLGWVIGMIIVLRSFESLASQLTRLSLGLLLLLVYVLLALIAFGYWLIAKGAKKLQKIEEI